MSLVQIAPSVRAAIVGLVEGSKVKNAAQSLSAGYRDQPGHTVLLNDSGKRAYLAARLPATYAAIFRALQRSAETGLDVIDSVLDAGCGPGTASLAATEIWPDIATVTRSDLDGSWRPIAEALGGASGYPALTRGRWLTGNLESMAYPTHDLVMAAYALNEIPAERRAAASANLWRAAEKALILIEPGTPQGFLNLRAARALLIQNGAQIAAPCPHHAACPMSETDWCHASVRLARDPLHRAAKGGQLPYEDEKFAYLCAVRSAPLRRPASRIVKRPVAHTGHLTLDLCGEGGLTRTTISRRDGALYKAARKAEWGDGWPPD
jgi:ribosomal protein RSM22 (predicted rRNA methylase)